MAIKFSKPKTRIIAKGESAEKTARKKYKNAEKDRAYLLPNDPRRNFEGRKKKVFVSKAKRIYPNFTYRKNLHPVMVKFWDMMRSDYTTQQLKGANMVSTGVAKRLWEFIYSNVPWPVGSVGGPICGNIKNDKVRPGIIPHSYGMTDPDILETFKTIHPHQKRRKSAKIQAMVEEQHHQLRQQKQQGTSTKDDTQPPSPEVIPTV